MSKPLIPASLSRSVSIALLYAIEGFSRAILIAVLPVQALAILGDTLRVSVLIFAVSVVGIFFNFALPWLVFRIGRPLVFALGAAAAFAAQPLFYWGTFEALVAGFVLQAAATAAIEIALNLYVMEIVRRQDMGIFEPMRVFLVGTIWVAGPVLGPYLKTTIGPGLPFGIAAALVALLYVVYVFVRPPEKNAPAAGKKPPLPTAYIGRFLRQPRLRLAWLLALVRNCLWNVIFYYAPLYAVTYGLGEVMGGAIISMGTASLFLIPLWGWIAQRKGYRRMLMGAYLAAGAFNAAMIVFAGAPAFGAALLVLSGFAGSIIDAAGNAHFLRAVHAYERAQMAAVYTTHRPIAQFTPPGVSALVLMAFELPAVFFVLGLSLVVAAYYTRYLPKRF